MSIKPHFTVEVRSCPRDKQGHRVKQTALEFLSRQPQSFLVHPWAQGACSLLHREVSIPQPCKGDLQSHHLPVWAPCTHEGREGLWGTLGSGVSLQVRVYMCTYMYTCMDSWAECGSSACRQQHGTSCSTSSWGAPGPPRPCTFLRHPEMQAGAPFRWLILYGAWWEGSPKFTPNITDQKLFGVQTPVGVPSPFQPWHPMSQATSPCPWLLTLNPSISWDMIPCRPCTVVHRAKLWSPS